MIQEKTVNCKVFEEKIYEMVCKAGCELYAQALNAWDAELHKARDRAVYRDKGHRKTTMKTLMGEVEYSRHVYTFADEEGGRGTIYLLDEAMGKTGSGLYSEALTERIGAAVCEMSYRKAAEEISSLTGQSISHAATWNVAQQLGEHVDEIERMNTAKAKDNKGSGELEAKLLFEEQDGIHLHLQGKDRKKHGASKEMKLSIAYDGAEKKGKKRYCLSSKVACANFENADKFYYRKEGAIDGVYNVDEVQLRVLNGDGASWIKRSIDADTIYQLDPFHRNRAITLAAPDNDVRSTMFQLLYSEQIDDLLIYIDALANSVDDEKREAALRELYTYFNNNSHGLISYNRRGIELPEPPEGKEYRTCGAMESNVFSIIGNRMKGRRKCWSISGANNLARLLCLKSTGKLRGTISALSSRMPEKYDEVITTVLSSAKIPNSVGKGWNGFNKATIPSSQKWLKNIVSIKLFSELRA